MGCNEMLVTDIWDSGLLKMFPELLDKLLYDNTTKKILFGQQAIMKKEAKNICLIKKSKRL